MSIPLFLLLDLDEADVPPRAERERCPDCGALLVQDGPDDDRGYCPECELVDAAERAAMPRVQREREGVRW